MRSPGRSTDKYKQGPHYVAYGTYEGDPDRWPTRSGGPARPTPNAIREALLKANYKGILGNDHV